jgi:hypothetical protein
MYRIHFFNKSNDKHMLSNIQTTLHFLYVHFWLSLRALTVLRMEYLFTQVINK